MEAGTTRKRLVRCDKADFVGLGITMVTVGCRYTSHVWHNDAWWHDPLFERASPLPIGVCPQKHLHGCLAGRPCGLCAYLGNWCGSSNTQTSNTNDINI